MTDHTVSEEMKETFNHLSPICEYHTILAHAYRFVDLLQEAAPMSREKSLALTNLEQALLWANAALMQR